MLITFFYLEQLNLVESQSSSQNSTEFNFPAVLFKHFTGVGHIEIDRGQRGEV